MHHLRRTSTLALRQRKAALLRQARLLPDLLRASFVERFTSCRLSTTAELDDPIEHAAFPPLDNSTAISTAKLRTCVSSFNAPFHRVLGGST